MGTQRRIAESLMEKYLLDEAEAYKRAKLIDELDLEDELADAVYELYSRQMPFAVAAQGVYELLGIIRGRLVELEQLEWPARRET